MLRKYATFFIEIIPHTAYYIVLGKTLGSALAVAALQCCSSKNNYLKIKN